MKLSFKIILLVFLFLGIKLNGQLRLELEELKLNKVQAVEDAKKESDELMMKMISKYENKIKELKEEADEMLQYP